ncbi:MAG: hypothetical protein HY054_05940 [Proteobacteria bacterium]|nr:hypothetical protein [Pseudomonadota bacterium]
MKLRVKNGRFEPASLFKFVFVGVLLGEGVIFVPFFLLMMVMFLVMPQSNIQGPRDAIFIVPVLLPMIIAMHTLMFGGMIVLGLWLFSLRGKLEIASED